MEILVFEIQIAVPVSPGPNLYSEFVCTCKDVAHKMIQTLMVAPINRIRDNVHGHRRYAVMFGVRPFNLRESVLASEVLIIFPSVAANYLAIIALYDEIEKLL